MTLKSLCALKLLNTRLVLRNNKVTTSDNEVLKQNQIIDRTRGSLYCFLERNSSIFREETRILLERNTIISSSLLR